MLLSCNYQGLVEVLMALVEKIAQPTVVVKGASPTDTSHAANQKAKKKRELGKTKANKGKGKGEARATLFAET
jgi:hypothetical protein